MRSSGFSFLVMYLLLFITIYGHFSGCESSLSAAKSRAIFNANHPVLKSLSVKLYNEALHYWRVPPLDVDPKMALIEYLSRSYSIWPNSEASEGLGDVFSSINNHAASIVWYELAMEIKPKDVGVIIKLGFEYHKSGRFGDAIALLQRGVNFHIQNQKNTIDYKGKTYNQVMGALLYHIGLSYSYLGDVQAAAHYFNNSINLSEENTAARINLAAILQKLGNIDDSVYHYDYVVDQVHRDFDAYANQIDNHFMMSSSNKIMAFYQLSNFDLAWDAFNAFFTLVSLHFSMCKGTFENKLHPIKVELSSQYCSSIIGNYYQLISHSLVLAIASLNWKSHEHHSALLISQFQREHSTILPFDSLLYEYTLKERYRIAIEYSNQKVNYFAKNGAFFYSFDEIKSSLFSNSNIRNDISSAGTSSSKQRPVLRIGLLSNDFSDHPTTHLIEGLLVAIKEARNKSLVSAFSSVNDLLIFDDEVLKQVQINLYNFGNNDGSLYRRMMEGLADNFMDLELNSYSEMANTINRDQIHVLLDLQVHTLGSRIEVLAKQPAPVQLNYLVYPGTSGTPFLGAIVVDRVVVPPEHASFYSESLLILPPSYQLSYYDRHISSASVGSSSSISSSSQSFNSINGRYLDKSRGMTIVNDIAHKLSIETLPEALKSISKESFLFCNFNKIDKLEPTTIHIWMNLLNQIPSSYLFLLAPLSILDSKSTNPKYGNFNVFGRIQNQIRQFANYYGVNSNRIVFVRKVNKTEHIQRHSVMDLFIDSFGKSSSLSLSLTHSYYLKNLITINIKILYYI